MVCRYDSRFCGPSSHGTPTHLRRLRTIGRTALVAMAIALAGGPATARSVTDLLDLPNPPTLAGNYLAGRFAAANRDIGAAAEYFQTAMAIDPADRGLAERTFQLLIADGRVKDAVAIAERLVRLERGHGLARLVLGVDALKKGQYETALRQFQATQKRPLSDLTVAVLSGWAQAGSGNVDAAMKTIDRVDGLDWYAVFKNYHAGLIAEMTGRRAEATRRLDTAFTADGQALRIVEAHVRNLARAGRKDDALAVLTAFDKQVPDHPLMSALRGEIEADRRPAPVVATPQAGAAEFLYGLGSVLGSGGGEDFSAIYLQLALWLQPDAELPAIALAGLQGQMKQYDRAIGLLARIPGDSKLRPLADIQVGRYYTVMQNFPEARKHLEAVIERRPKDLDAIVALGDVLRADKKFGEAAEIYTRAIDQIATPSRNDWSFFYYRGIALERTKQWPKAEADFDEALRLMPDEPHVLNYLGYSWIDMGINLDKGLDLVRKAVALKSDDGYIVDSLAWAYFKLGRYDEAVTELERAILLKPDDPVINDHLGDAYWKVDRRLEATFQWHHALDMKPEADDRARIERKLKEGLVEPATLPTAATAPAAPADPAPATSPQ